MFLKQNLPLLTKTSRSYKIRTIINRNHYTHKAHLYPQNGIKFSELRGFSIRDQINHREVAEVLTKKFNECKKFSDNGKLKLSIFDKLSQHNENKQLMSSMQNKVTHLQLEGISCHSDYPEIQMKIDEHDYSDIFIFPNGCIVFWNFDKKTCEKLIQKVFEELLQGTNEKQIRQIFKSSEKLNYQKIELKKPNRDVLFSEWDERWDMPPYYDKNPYFDEIISRYKTHFNKEYGMLKLCVDDDNSNWFRLLGFCSDLIASHITFFLE